MIKVGYQAILIMVMAIKKSWLSLKYNIILASFFLTKYWIAKVAQLVEHHVANVRVDGSNPFFRSRPLKWGLFLASYPSGKGAVCKTVIHQFESGRRLNCRGGETGRHKGLKIPRIYIFVPVRFRPSVLKKPPFFILGGFLV